MSDDTIKLYYKIEKNKIIDLNTEEINEKYNEIEVKTEDEFYNKLNNYTIEDEDLISQLKDYFDTQNLTTSDNIFTIKHWVSNRSFGELIDMYENEEIIKPDMQRAFVWDSIKCSRLIESIILGLPIPPLFLMESGKNEYELIDGFQRLTAIFNYVKGKPWYDNPNVQKKVASRLSNKLMVEELRGKKFDDLSGEHQVTIKRSTIPLIEFRQLSPCDLSSKYLIFERINTGSEKLNPMQIRKSLTHGDYMKDLYKYGDQNDQFKSLFSINSLKKDVHIEAFLRVIVMSDIFYKNYNITCTGIKNILNEYCEKNKDNRIDEGIYIEFSSAINRVFKIFEGNDDKIFKKVEKFQNDDFKVIGSLNTGILEAMLGVIINNQDTSLDKEIYINYGKRLFKVLEDSLSGENDNPFSTSTGIKESIRKRFEIFEEILGVTNENS